MKVLVQRTSDWHSETVREFDNLEQCVDTLLKEVYGPENNGLKQPTPELVISKVRNYMKDEYSECAYCIELYDTWRE